VLGNKLIVFGGEGSAAEPAGVFPQVEAYDPAADRWEPLPDMMDARHGFGAAVLDDRLYLPGGATRQGAGAVDTHSVFFFE
jgi:N-acetylneuraminic acid mutarotase